MSAYYSDDLVTLHHGDCVEVMRELPEASVDAVVTDPPYGLAFMGKEWDDAKRMVGQMAKGKEQRGALAYGGSHDRGYADHDANGFQLFSQAWATEALRVLKPGGHLLAFGGTRTWHRLAVAIEDAGFEVRDSIAWMYGSGFPKSLDVSKAIDKAAGVERPDRVTSEYGGNAVFSATKIAINKGTQITPAAQQRQGWGTALKPAFEPIVVARKPLDGTVAENVLRHGTGALNIDGSRIGTEVLPEAKSSATAGGEYIGQIKPGMVTPERVGRWPANVILDESQAAELDRQSGV
ncbi:MAG: DNA-methyltransferase, partial [Burkholderiaceae bacterium]